MDLAEVLISQYLAALEMLKETIIECPEPLWDAASDRNRFWHTAYHALFFTHLYVADSEETFTPWMEHREGYEEFERLEDLQPYDKDTILEYLAFCQGHVAERVPKLNLAELEGFEDRSLTTAERQINSIRHLMLHTGELMERLGTRTGAEIDWVAWVHGVKGA